MATEIVGKPVRRIRRRHIPRWSWPVGVVAVITLACLLGSVLTGQSVTDMSNAPQFAGVTADHVLGTDELGRDLLTRVLEGGRLSLVIAAGASLLSVLLGVIWGMAAVLGGRVASEVLMRMADLVMGVPGLLLALLLVAALGENVVALTVIIGVLLSPSTARVMRAVAMTERSLEYADAAVAFGSSRVRLVLRELLPNMAAPLLVQISLNAARAIMVEAALSFLGLGIQPPDASWGALERIGYQFMYQSPGYVIFPGLFIVVTIWALNTLSDTLGVTRTTNRIAP